MKIVVLPGGVKQVKAAMRSALADGVKESVVTNERVNRDDDNEVSFTPKIGQLMMFEYNARVSKQVLPFYDQLSCRPCDASKDRSFLGSKPTLHQSKEKIKNN